MFDQQTAELIRSTPDWSGLDTDNLPDFFTEAYARIAAARVRLQSDDEVTDTKLEDMLRTFRRLAAANEALVVSAPDADKKIAAALVAATAHQLCHNAEVHLTGDRPETSISYGGISSDIAATLLFLVAEATSDAAEMAQALVSSGESKVQSQLIRSIKCLAVGDLAALQDTAPLTPEEVLSGDVELDAINSLFFMLDDGVKVLANTLLEPRDDMPVAPVENVFDRIMDLCIGPSLEELGSPPVSFPGPYHLASLLREVARDLGSGALTRIPAPDGLSPKNWNDSLARFARSRPFLWRNHREAVASGYLQTGVSAAVGFPTGAGKSTLAELKINAALLRNRAVVFLAPTHALVDQTAQSLAKSFPETRVQGERQNDLEFGLLADDAPEIAVLTPEACLAQISIDASFLDKVGLLVFDECHLMHSESSGDSRRAIDSMLCVLAVTKCAPEADLLLLSAMMKNTEEIAGWIRSLTKRPCLSLSLAWKPTRQLRGSVVYKQEDIDSLQTGLTSARAEKKTKFPSSNDKKQLKATPLALFSLKQTWATNQRSDYALVSLSNDDINLAASKYWKVTPNAVQVSSELASLSAKSGVKTLVFFQTIKNAVSAARRAAQTLPPASIKLTAQESEWWQKAAIELGGSRHLYLEVEDLRVQQAAAVHHGLLLPDERRLVESLYKRSGGLNILTATSTVSQGMNFPSELVIIAEDSRFDKSTEKREVLKAQELLNAAGRAGRAGQSAAGIVLVIPGNVVGIDEVKSTIGPHWGTLRSVFGQSDQCLDIVDPLTTVLDRVHVEVTSTSDLDKYVIGRLATDSTGLSDTGTLATTIKNSLAAYKARQQADRAWIDDRLNSAIDYYSRSTPESEEDIIEHQLAAALGLPKELVTKLAAALTKNPPKNVDRVPEWRKWFFRWLNENPEVIEQVFRPQNLQDLFGEKAYSSWTTTREKAENILPVLAKLIWKWMGGATLSEMERVLIGDTKDVKECQGARKFVIRIVPDLAYLFGLPAKLFERSQAGVSVSKETPAVMAQISRCARMGFNFHTKAALNDVLRNARLSRRQVHQRYEAIKPFLRRAAPNETWESTLDRVKEAVDKEATSRAFNSE